MIGDLLRAERERQGLSVKDIEKATSIRALYIDAIEKGEHKTLPGDAYAKGFVRNYARYLQLDADDIVNKFSEEICPPEPVAAAESSVVEEAGSGQTQDRKSEEYRGPKITALESYPMEKKQTEAAPKPAADGLEMKLSFTDRCWTRVVVDGKTEFEGTAEKGKVLTVKGKDKVHITAGNAGALSYSLNGKDMGAIGQRGEVVEKNFTKDAVAH